MKLLTFLSVLCCVVSVLVSGKEIGGRSENVEPKSYCREDVAQTYPQLVQCYESLISHPDTLNLESLENIIDKMLRLKAFELEGDKMKLVDEIRKFKNLHSISIGLQVLLKNLRPRSMPNILKLAYKSKELMEEGHYNNFLTEEIKSSFPPIVENIVWNNVCLTEDGYRYGNIGETAGPTGHRHFMLSKGSNTDHTIFRFESDDGGQTFSVKSVSYNLFVSPPVDDRGPPYAITTTNDKETKPPKWHLNFESDEKFAFQLASDHSYSIGKEPSSSYSIDEEDNIRMKMRHNRGFYFNVQKC